MKERRYYSLLLVDVHVRISRLLKQIIEQAIPVISSLDLSATAGDALKRIKEHTYDLYILDLDFPDLSEFELIDRIRCLDAKARILIHTLYDELWEINPGSTK